MKKSLLPKLCIISLIALASYGNLNAQVGINTTTPQAGAILDVESTDKGLLVPRVNIANLNTIAPITGGATESLLVYNTNTSTGVGFHYWTGSLWFPILSDDWKSSGNMGTSPATNFIGTVDNVDMSFRTNNAERLRVMANGGLRAYTGGSASAPLFHWNGDTDTGFYHPGADEFTITTAGTDRLTIDGNGAILANSAGSAANPLFAWAGDTNKGFYSPGADLFGLVTNGVERLRIPNSNQIFAMADGTNAAPFFSWNADADSGLWRSTADRLNITAGGREMVEFNENGSNSEVVFNDGSAITNFRIETDNDANTLFVDAVNDNVGLGTNAPNASAQLEMTNTDKGILINRVALTATNSAGPVTSPATGLLVYNTANSSSGSTQVLPGFYYWDGSQWIAMGGTGGKDWSLEGNAGTSVATNFLGTTDNTSMSFKTNDIERVRVDSDGTVGIGSLPYTNATLRVNKPGETFGVIAETSSTGGAALYGTDTGTGLGIFGTSSNNHGIYGTTAYTGSAFLIGGIIGWGTGTTGSNGVLAVTDQPASSKSNMGIRAVSGSTTSISSSQVMNVGVNTNATDLALYAMTEGPITSLGTIEAARFQTNYTGSAINSDARDPRAQLAGYTTSSLVGGGSMYYGGYMYSGGSSSNSSYAYAGARYSGTNYKIIGNGTVSTIVEGVDGEDKVMFAPEAPEVLFEDYGTGTLVNGVASIDIDPTFTNNIIVDSDHPLKVFIQLEGDCNGVFVADKSASGFKVQELSNGTSNVPFSWHIVANRKDVNGTTAENSSNYSNLRFPTAPKVLAPTNNASNEVQAVDDNTFLQFSEANN